MVVSTAAKVLRTYSPAWCLYRVWYAMQRRTGLLRLRMPSRPWASQPLASWLRRGVPSEPAAYVAWRKSQSPRFFFDNPQLHFAAAARLFSAPIAEADAVLAGAWRYFSQSVFEVGFPPDWHWNPLSGHRILADRHWSQIDPFGDGDIKLVWEASRFTVAYLFVRAYAATGDERYARAFWCLVEDWVERNPYQLGPNWYDGQEAALRVMAWCFGLFGFGASTETRPERVGLLAAVLAAHALRIERNTAYSRAQKNNHAISEGTGLWTTGLLFPEFEKAEHWREQGRRILEEEARRQIYADGSYVMHSTNYHRLMLQNYLWAIRLGELHGCPLSGEVNERVARAVRFLYQLTDAKTGQAPNYGSNDGALVLPLNNCDYSDFRPVLQAAHYQFHRSFLFPPGPWDEDLLWLVGSGAAERAAERSEPPHTAKERLGAQVSSSAREGGYFVLRGNEAWAMIRCAALRDRPGHADQLHFDLWWRGTNVACDAGTFLYNGEPPWDNGLAETAVHNTVTVDAQSQAQRFGHFLWLDWAQAIVRWQRCSERGLLEFWEGEHNGYRKLSATHRRAVLRIGDNLWLVVDDVLGAGQHRVRLHWLLPDLEYRWEEAARRVLLRTSAGELAVHLCSSQPAGLTLVRAGKYLYGSPSGSLREERNDTLRGWRSRYYAHKEPALSIGFEARAHMPLRFVTLFSCSLSALKQMEPRQVLAETDDSTLTVWMSPLGTSPIIETATLTQGDSVERI